MPTLMRNAKGFSAVAILSLLAILMVAVAPFDAAAQSESASVSGRVTDQQNAVIPNVEVEIRNVDTNSAQVTKTNGDGIYTFASLRPGNYVMSVRKEQFETVSVTGITLHVQDSLSRNFTLQIGSSAVSVTVEANGININTTDATVGTVIDRNFVANTPLNGRSFQDLISMTPGVVTQSPNQSPTSAGSGGDFSVNGQRTESNYYTVDGVSANIAAGTGVGSQVSGQTQATSGSVPAATALGTTQSLISVDALQEFRVQSSTYSAEYGRSPGGQFSLLTRSGTNDFHGSAFDYIRNDFFDANDWFSNYFGKPISPLRQNDFGGTFGGPIVVPHLYRGKDKTFFFFSYEGLRLTQPQATSVQLVPDVFMRQQAPPELQPILNAFPVPNGIDNGTAAAPGLAQSIAPFSQPSQIDSVSVRVDHTFGPKLSLFFRFGDTPSSAKTRGPGALSALTSAEINTRTYTLGGSSQLSNTMSNEFRIGYATSTSSRAGTIDQFGGATPVNLGAAMGVGSAVGPFSAFFLFAPGGATSLRLNSRSSNELRQWNVTDTLRFVFGRHQLTAGIDYRRINSPGNPPSPTVLAAYIGAGSVLNNKATILQVGKAIRVTPIFDETAAFVQDEWRVGPRVNISLGLRWEVDPAPHGADGNDPFTVLGSISNPGSLTLAPHGTPLWKTTWYNFAPRLGLAWVARNSPGWETVVRAGGGVFFDTNNQVASAGFSGLGFVANPPAIPGSSLPVTPAQLNFNPSPPSVPYNLVYAFPEHLQLPYTLQWNMSLQQAMGKAQALTLSYVGAAGRRLPGQQQLSLGTLNPNFGTVFYWSSLTSDYDALQAQFQRSIGKWRALASYTLSHCLDSGSNYYAFIFIRGNCDVDVRNNFQAGVDWDLPGASGSKLAEALLNHWGLDGRLIARTGFPINPVGPTSTDPATGQLVSNGLDVVPGQPIYLYGSNCASILQGLGDLQPGQGCPGGRAINPNAFVPPAGCDVFSCPTPTPGNAPRNFVRGFGAWQINFAVRREFPIHEKLRLQFRAEAFNILNHPNFGYVDPYRYNSTFGQALNSLNQSLGTVASQYQQGGPRSMQFALKLLF